MFGHRFELFKIFGFAIRLDLSWFLLAVLITWSLATGYFPQQHQGLATEVLWLMGAAGALGLFVSVVLHELAHALVARRYDLPIKGITLFIFGGVAEMEDEPPSARAEFMVAVAGPVASAVIGAAFYGLAAAAAWPESVRAVLVYLGLINLVLVAFNVVPAFPLDGGRMLRSALWAWKDDLRWSTRVTSAIGSGFGSFLIILGVIGLLTGTFIGGLWWILIGFFLRGAAQMSHRELLLRRALEGEPVRRFMHDAPVSVPRSISIQELVEDYVYRHHHKMYPVVDGDRLVGCVTTQDVKNEPREEWNRQSVGTIARPCGDGNTVKPDDDAMDALAKMRREGASRFMVVEGDHLVGILSLKDLLGFFSLKVELEGGR